MKYSLRQATYGDRPFAELLHEQCYREVVIRQFGGWDPAVQQQFFDRKWQPDQYRVIVLDGAAVGLLAVHQQSDQLYLSDIQIHPSRQNQGIGSAILTDLLEQARTLGVPLRLQVLQANRARAFYEKLGLVCYGQTDTHLFFEQRCT